MYDPPANASLWQAIAVSTAVAALLALAVVYGRLCVHRRRAERRATANGLLINRKRQLRDELRIAGAERDAAVEEAERAQAVIAELRAQIDGGLRWRNELRQATAEQDSYLMKPHPNRSREERRAEVVREAWASQMRARMAAPDVIPPHEQRPKQDGATE